MNWTGQYVHPLGGILRLVFDIQIEFGDFSKKLYENTARIHQHVMQVIKDRKKGLQKSKMQGFDMLSVFLEDQETFSDERIVQNIVGFIFGATDTTKYQS